MATPVILDEDTYTEAISLIIERDFFPNLATMKAQQNYHEAQNHGSLSELQEAGKTLHTMSMQKKTHQSRQSDQPINFYNEDEPNVEKRVNLSLSLDQFQTLYTSEDNASFTGLLEKANIRVKEQNKWFFDRESKQLRITDHSTEESHTKLIEANDKAPSGWKYKARNALMYFPQGKSESWVNENDARGLPKSIEYHNTHIATTDVKSDNSTSKPDATPKAPSDIAALAGSLTPWSQMNGLNSDPLSSSPNIRGYNLVDATPTLSPDRLGTPQMTWGSIEGTPSLISAGSQTPGPQFSLPKVSKREELGFKLSEKASKAYRKKKGEHQRNVQGTQRTGAGLMSPAAQYLLRKSHTTPRAQTGFGEALRNTYGGSPLGVSSPRTLRKVGATPTPTGLFRAGVTPQKTMMKKKN
ncbi:nuclear protein Es2-domain-containing protein [Parasitella parasitica]|nr:nuclear protein Es2-domain-containing protein [Parasitella parasitica]